MIEADPGNILAWEGVTFYHGDPLQWLSWGGQFKALVHDTKMTSKAMMSFLQTKVSKDYDQVIACLLPDDEGYAEALMSSISEDITSNGYRRSRQRSCKVPIIYWSRKINILLSCWDYQYLAARRRYSLGESPFVLSLIYEQTVKLSQEDGKIWRTKEGDGPVNMTSGAFSTCLGARGRSYCGALPPQTTPGRK